MPCKPSKEDGLDEIDGVQNPRFEGVFLFLDVISRKFSPAHHDLLIFVS